MLGFAQQALPGCGVDQFQAARWISFRPPASYGVEVVRADVKDLVFPGNLREVMNKVIETERLSEAQLITARTQAEVATLQAKSQAATLQEKILADEKRVKQLAENPLLLKLKELEVLEAIGARGNNHFYVGVDKLSRT